MVDHSEDSILSVTQWFADRGLGVQFSADDDEDGERFFWADPTRLPSGRVVTPLYGRGEAELAAARRAPVASTT
ncbi:MAG: hypothetical protein ACYDEY_04270 [Acidimicrobiales bacterium]